jgi:hypothetical protein
MVNRRILYLFIILIPLIAFYVYYEATKLTTAWVTADKFTPSDSSDIIDVSNDEIQRFTALINALENADKYGHHTDAFSMDSKVADELLSLISDKLGIEIEPYSVQNGVKRYHFRVRLEDTQETFGVSIDYQREKPLIL